MHDKAGGMIIIFHFLNSEYKARGGQLCFVKLIAHHLFVYLEYLDPQYIKLYILDGRVDEICTTFVHTFIGSRKWKNGSTILASCSYEKDVMCLAINFRFHLIRLVQLQILSNPFDYRA